LSVSVTANVVVEGWMLELTMPLPPRGISKWLEVTLGYEQAQNWVVVGVGAASVNVTWPYHRPPALSSIWNESPTLGAPGSAVDRVMI